MAKKHSARKAPKKKPGTAKAKATPNPRAAAPTLSVPIFQVDAFTGRLFHGNPAAVVPLDKWLHTDTLQAIAAENNLAETAFFVADKPRAGVPRYSLRWFTPTMEIDLCGHATLASAHVLWNHLGLKGTKVIFKSRSGDLPVSRRADLIELDFPSRKGAPVPITDRITSALGRVPVEAYKSRDLMLVFNNRRDVHELRPAMEALADLDCLGVIVTAPGSGHDFVSRFFAPRAGISEDPVTGSAHCTLVPYWADRLRKKRVTGHQVSRRAGELFCELRGKRVGIAGRAVTYLRGIIAVPA